ncbi:MAG: ArsR/SmtB family transcription factor [Terriglobales bacterium]
MERELAEMEAVLGALADATRLRILALLAQGEVCVCDIHESLQIPQPRASRHLAYLRRRGLVLGRRQGLWIYYRMGRPRDPALAVLVEALIREAARGRAARRDAERLRRRIGARQLIPKGEDNACRSSEMPISRPRARAAGPGPIISAAAGAARL